MATDSSPASLIVPLSKNPHHTGEILRHLIFQGSLGANYSLDPGAKAAMWSYDRLVRAHHLLSSFTEQNYLLDASGGFTYQLGLAIETCWLWHANDNGCTVVMQLKQSSQVIETLINADFTGAKNAHPRELLRGYWNPHGEKAPVL
jgi:hypothetical protein